MEPTQSSRRFRLIRACADAYWRRWLRTRRPWRSDLHDTMPRELSPSEWAACQEIMRRHCRHCAEVAALNERPPIGGRYYCAMHAPQGPHELLPEREGKGRVLETRALAAWEIDEPGSGPNGY